MNTVCLQFLRCVYYITFCSTVMTVTWEADNILTDAIPTDDIPTDNRDMVRVLGIGLVVGLGLVTLLQSSFVGTKSVGIQSVGIESVGIVWCIPVT